MPTHATAAKHSHRKRETPSATPFKQGLAA